MSNNKKIKAMKKILLSVLMSMMFVAGLFAQTQVQPGDVHTFTVNLLNGVTLHSTTPYTWSHSGTGIVSATANQNQYTVTFSNTIGTTGHIEVFATSADNCRSDIKSIDVTVQPLTYTATFATASQDVCPRTTGNPSGGDAAAVTINFTGGNVNSFVYTLDGVSTTVTLPVPGTSYSLDLNTAFTNADAGAHVIEIVSITGGTITSIQPNGSVVHTINVETAPAISDIF